MTNGASYPAWLPPKSDVWRSCVPDPERAVLESPCACFMFGPRPHGTLNRQGPPRARARRADGWERYRVKRAACRRRECQRNDGPHGASTKVRPIRFFWIQATLHSRTEESLAESLAMTRRKRWGTNAGFSTSMAAPSAEIFRTMQPMTKPPDDT